MNVKRLTFKPIPIAACLLLCGIIGCFTFTDLRALATPSLVATTFYSQNNRWPTSRVELVECATNALNNLSFTNELYSTLTLDVQTNGSLVIHCELAPPAKGSSTFQLEQPKVTKY